MSALCDALEELRLFLAGHPSLSEMNFCEEYPPVQKPSPLSRVTVAVGLAQASCSPGALGRLIGQAEGLARYGEDWVIRIRLMIHAPHHMGGSACRKAFEQIWEALCLEQAFPILAAGCGPVSTSRETGSLQLEAWLELRLPAGNQKESGETA